MNEVRNINLMHQERSVLITGAGGFLGGELIEQLSQKANYKIIALTSNKDKVMTRFSNIDNLECFNIEEWKRGVLPLSEIDTLIHCAFARGYRLTQEIAESLQFTNELFRTAFEKKVLNIINISSQAVYGKTNKPLWEEKTPVAPESVYGISKYASELLGNNISIMSGNQTKSTNLRLASLTGGKEGLKLEVISKFVDKALKSETIKIIGGKQIFSYIDVRDAAAGIISLLSINSKEWKNVYNLGSNKRYCIVDIARLVAEVAKEYTNNSVSIQIEYKDIYLDVGMDASLFYQDTQWRPQHEMRDTIKTLFEYLNHKTQMNKNIK